MNDNVIQIFSTKENTVDFNITTQGLSEDNLKVCFVIETSQMNVSFYAQKQEGEKWRVTIPPMAFLEKTAYNFCIYVVADEYYFEPFRGVVNIVSTPELYVTMPDTKLTTAIPPSIPIAEPIEVAIIPPEENNVEFSFENSGKKQGEKGIAQLAQEAIRKKKSKQEEAKKETEKKDKKTKISEAVKDVLESLSGTNKEGPQVAAGRGDPLDALRKQAGIIVKKGKVV